MILGYPAFQILFNKVNHTVYEVPVLLLLPIFKIITKRLFALAALKKWDMVPEQVIFTVDFFDALYLVTCMPSLSAVSFGIILAVDIAQTAIDLFELFHRTQHIPARLHRAARIRDNVDSFSLLAFARLICFNSKILQNQEIQVRSCIPHQLSHQERTVLAQLERCSAACPPTNLVHHSLNRISTSPQRLVAIPDHGRSAVAVHPHPTVSVAPKKTQGDDLVNGDKESSELNSWIVDGSDALQEALEVLFTAECLILTEYLDIVVPVLYGTFLLAMTHLPGAQYHTEMASVTRENVANTVSSVLIYAALELLSFIALAFVMKRNCGIDAYYQLAFVLRTQMPFVLSKLILWMMFTLTFRVTHFGTFR
ncbi:hypothetical protein GN244_ATG17831 [Phytophthora infestans]|uniref:Transmembrane protein n=1 Tax=Phytophthora infestans TaxID=4787 RepID=A0A833SGJ9_PHYIN|nr:hypothetical protein GN244_ATG17831 [Phytophthora infestans]